MNPFFEQTWRDAHAMLIAYMRDALQERLPPDLIARAEEEMHICSAGERASAYRPDIQIRDPWTLKEPAAVELSLNPTPPIATEPIRVHVEEEIERWLEIRDSTGRLITVIALLSPTNKLETTDRDRYLGKRRALSSGGVNLVEVDLVRQGAWIFPKKVCEILNGAAACYGICVMRAGQPSEHEVYPIRLRERLPAIRIPLRPADGDLVLDLQPLIDQCHERGRYHMLNYRMELDPPLAPDDAAWANQLLFP